MKPHHVYGECPPDKAPERVNEKGYAYPMKVSPSLIRYFRWRYPKVWIVPSAHGAVWLDIALEVLAILTDVFIAIGITVASVLVAVGFVLAFPGRIIERAGKELGYRVWTIEDFTR